MGRGPGWGARRLPVETLSNPGRAGGGPRHPWWLAARRGAARARRLRGALGAGQRVLASRRRWGEPAAGGGRLSAGVYVCVCVGVPARVPRGEHARGCRSPLRGGGRGRCRPRSPRGFPGLAGPERCRCQSRAGRQRACCLPACRRVCLEEVECCPSVCGLNSLSGRNPTPFVKWEDEKCVF